MVFVGRITRQKGVPYLLDAALSFDPSAQVVLLRRRARHPRDRPRGGREVEKVAEERGNIIWIEKMLERHEVIQLLTHATVFVCPSVYEPLGIVNLEAMACETAVVATATGGIPEVVADGVTGLLVPFEGRRRRAHRPGQVRGRLRRTGRPAAGRPGPGGAFRQGGTAARPGRVQLAGDRRPDRAPLRGAGARHQGGRARRRGAPLSAASRGGLPRRAAQPLMNR